MTDFDKKWITYLCIVLAVTFLLGRAGYWTLTSIFGVAVTGEDGKTVVEVSSTIETIRKLITPVLMVGGVFITSAAYAKHRDNDTE